MNYSYRYVNYSYRYVNNGRRIDYILVDRQLHECHVETGPDLWYDEDEAGALSAATAGGRRMPAPHPAPMCHVVW